MLRRIHDSVRSAFTIVNAINGIARAVTVIRQHTDDKEVLALVKTIADAYEKLCSHPVVMAWDKEADDIDNRRRDYSREKTEHTFAVEAIDLEELYKRLDASCKALGHVIPVRSNLEDLIFEWGSDRRLSLSSNDVRVIKEELESRASKFFLSDNS